LKSRAVRRGLWVLLLWIVVAGLALLPGCVGKASFASDPAPAPTPADTHYPTTYPEATPGPDEVVLRWDGTLLNGQHVSMESAPLASR